MTSNQSTNMDSTLPREEQRGQIQIDDTTRRFQVQVTRAQRFHVDEEWGTYPMKSKPRGLAVILNSRTNRDGSDADVQNLKELCEQLGFHVLSYQDLGARETLNTLDEVVKNPLLPHVDMLMVFIMSHGDRNEIHCVDDISIDTEEILEKFTCPVLQGKPKFIVFQSCRGHKHDLGIPRQKVETDARPINKEERDPSWMDMIVAYSTVPCFVSYRDTLYGSWFIESLVKVFMKNACEKDLLLLLRDVGDMMDQMKSNYGFKQSFVYENRHFKRKLYFNPGLNNLEKIVTGLLVRCLQYDEKNIVAGLNNGEIHVYNKQTLILEHVIKGNSGVVNCLQFNGNILLSGYGDKAIKIYSNLNYQLFNTLELDGSVLDLKCNFNDMLVTGTGTGTYAGKLTVWKMKSPTDIEKTKVLYSDKEYRCANYYCVDFDATHIVNGFNNYIQVWCTKSLELLKTMRGHTETVYSLQIKNDLVVSGSWDKTIRIWKIQTGSCLRILIGHTDRVLCVKFDIKQIVSASDDKTIKVWNLDLNPNIASDTLCVRTMEEHTNSVFCLEYDETQIVSGSLDKTILIQNFHSPE